MREQLRADIVNTLRSLATEFVGSQSSHLSDVADEVEFEIDEGDEVECPTSKYNVEFLAEDGVEVGDLVMLRVGDKARERRGVGEVVRTEGGGTLEGVTVVWANEPDYTNMEYRPMVLDVIDRSARARTMHVAYVSWLDNVVVVTDDDGCHAEIVTVDQCKRVRQPAMGW